MSATTIIDLPDNLTIATAEKFHHDLEAHILEGQDVVLNGEAVERVDTAGLQLVYAFIHTLKKNHGASVSWKAISETLMTSATQLGIDSHLAMKTN